MIALGSHPVLVIAAASALALGCSQSASGSRTAPGKRSAGISSNSASDSRRAQASAGSNAPAPATNAGSAAPAPPAAAPDAATPRTTAAPKPALDPNIGFDWPESPPGGGAACQAGTYTGTFDCVFSDPSGLIPDVELTGPVSLTFSKSKDGEFLEITQGDFEAIGNDLIGGKAKIQGKLDCASMMLDAMAVNGEWTIGDPQAPLVTGGALEGQITGTLDPATGTLSGQWNFADPAIGACPGTWSVMHTP